GLGGGLDPVNGIYLRWSTTTYFAVCRSANSETVLNTGITANTTPRTFKFAITPTAVVVSEAGVTLGTISATIPTADLALCAAVGNTTDAADLDFFDVEFTR
ncbi:MAG TPA: hypothetical protein VLZ09_08800, partial [Gaiellaceae bacterium]|nr:hypothetical protein [Gaiellaceae bacterium]